MKAMRGLPLNIFSRPSIGWHGRALYGHNRPAFNRLFRGPKGSK
jgi:hypothetical protein